MAEAQVLAASGAADTTAIAVTVIATLVVVALLVLGLAMLRTVRHLRQVTDDLARDTHAVLRELRGTLDAAAGDLERVDGLLATAESISSTVDSASRLAYSTFSTPVIKVLAFGSGTARAARRLKDGPDSEKKTVAAPERGRAAIRSPRRSQQ